MGRMTSHIDGMDQETLRPVKKGGFLDLTQMSAPDRTTSGVATQGLLQGPCSSPIHRM